MLKSTRQLTQLFFVIFLLVSFTSAGQSQKTIAVTNGKWKFESYGKMLKCTFSPTGYLLNEQISNAVVARPSGQMSPGAVTTAKHAGSFKLFDVVLAEYFDSSGHKGFRFLLRDGEKIFGTGERSIPMDRRGYKLNLYNQPNYGYGMNAENLNYSVPFIISSGGYGIFFDNASKGYLDIGKTKPHVLEYGACSGELTFYIIPGKNVKEILGQYHSLTGTQPLPARWVFGNLMSRFGYRSEAHLNSIVKKMQEENFPVDAVILDLFWFGDSIKGTMGNLDWVNKKAWPDPADMIKKLRAQGINTVIITEPFVLNTTANYESSKKFHAVDSTGKPFLLTDFYFGHGGLLDLFRKDAQDWFWSKYKMQMSKGVAGWWGDLGEPERHPADMMHNLKDLGFKRLFKADEVHNIYGHYWDKMLFDKYAKEYPNVRLFNLNRSGYAGSSRYGVFPWSGDVGRNWSGLQAQLPLMLGMSLSGVPYIHADAGGFAGGDGDEELYTRWLQFAAFTPVFRPHGTAFGDLEPGVKDIPSEGALYDDPYKSIVRKYIQLRYQLLPYNYTLAYRQAKFGEPLVRPMFFENYADSNLLNAGTQFMWGDNLLVAPVIEKGAVSKNVYLPEGGWYNFITEEKVTGKRWLNETVGLDNIPVYAKEGSFIPMFVSSKRVKNTSEYSGREITVKYFPASLKTKYTLFDDDGHTNNTLAKNKYELIHFEGQTIGNRIRISIKPGTAYHRFPRELKIQFPASVQIDFAKVNKAVIKSSEQSMIIVQYNGKPYDIEISTK